VNGRGARRGFQQSPQLARVLWGQAADEAAEHCGLIAGRFQRGLHAAGREVSFGHDRPIGVGPSGSFSLDQVLLPQRARIVMTVV
jgi:hypothetical protein